VWVCVGGMPFAITHKKRSVWESFYEQRQFATSRAFCAQNAVVAYAYRNFFGVMGHCIFGVACCVTK